jgi:PqqD family protein of HPr-rel-A system
LTAAAARIEALGSQVAVFNSTSFETHLVNEAAGALLLNIAETPRTAAELAELLAELLRPAERGNAATYARDTLARLESLGLVDCVSPR